MTEIIGEHIETPEEEKARQNMISLSTGQERIDDIKNADIIEIKKLNNVFAYRPEKYPNIVLYINEKGEDILDLSYISGLSSFEKGLNLMGYRKEKVNNVYNIYKIDSSGKEELMKPLSTDYYNLWKDAKFYALRITTKMTLNKSLQETYIKIGDTPNSLGALENNMIHGTLKIKDLESYLLHEQIPQEMFDEYLIWFFKDNGKLLLQQCGDIKFWKMEQRSIDFKGDEITEDELGVYYNSYKDKVFPGTEKKMFPIELFDQCVLSIKEREKKKVQLLKQQKNIQEHSHEEREELQTPVQGAIKWIKEKVGGLLN